MLTFLSIKNYALINDLRVDFNDGLSIITGETGAGKSILLGALGLVLGNRADLSSLKESDKKCIIEAHFDVRNYGLEALFQTNDLDYEAVTIIRREILPSGKSRAFVNDTPTNLSGVKALGERLIDIHSQHETLQLSEHDFQLQVLDALSNNTNTLSTYRAELKTFIKHKKALAQLEQQQAESVKTHDYNVFLLEELNKVPLTEIDFDTLEEDFNALSNVETIKEHLSSAHNLLSEEETGILSFMRQIQQDLQKASALSSKYDLLFNRIESSSIEIDDIFNELELAFDNLDDNPEELQRTSDTLQAVNALFHKHAVNTIPELLDIQSNLNEAVASAESIEDDIKSAKSRVEASKKMLKDLADTLHNNRKAASPKLISQLENMLSNLGMPNASFEIQLEPTATFTEYGSDTINFLFTANKGAQLQPIKKAASGGELSRIMLAIKAILSNYIKLPSIIFDEIDTGVSGEIANKMGDIMKQMGANMQIISITHLPQIAAKGHTHYRVFKITEANTTQTKLKELDTEERIMELAHMLEGKTLSDSAVAHAKQLLN